jgi:ELWxxDGT repeat protein
MRARDGQGLVCFAICAALVAILPSAAIAAPGDATATQVANIRPVGSSSPMDLANVGGLLFFSATDGTNGTELWKSTGGPLGAGGTQLASNITGDSGDSNPRGFTDIGGTVLFSAQDASGDQELWKSVPPYNAASTTLVENISSMGSSQPDLLTNVNGTLLFAAGSPGDPTGVELWKSVPPFDAASTSLVEDINTQMASIGSFPDKLTDVNGTLFFQADDGLTGTELWKSAPPFDAGSTSRVDDIDPGDDTPAGGGPDSSFPDELTNVGGTLLFSASDGANGTELWKSVGPNYNAASTTMVQNINAMNDSDPRDLANVGGALFFNADNATKGAELWKSVSPFNAGATDIVADIFPMSSGSDPHDIVDVNGTAFFQAADGTNGTELWKSGGTAPTTTMVANINPTGTSNPFDLTAVGSQVFFRANDGTNGTELWKSNGTGATLVRDINPLAMSSSNPDWLTNVNGTLFFSASDSTGNELWKATIEPAPAVVPVAPAPATPTKKTKCKKKKGKKGAAAAKKKKCKKKKK